MATWYWHSSMARTAPSLTESMKPGLRLQNLTCNATKSHPQATIIPVSISISFSKISIINSRWLYKNFILNQQKSSSVGNDNPQGSMKIIPPPPLA